VTSLVAHVGGVAVFDDLLPGKLLAHVRAAAESQDYAAREHKGIAYEGVGTEIPYDPWPVLSRALGRQVRPVIYEGRPLTFFRRSRHGEDSTTWIHPDTGVDGEFAGVLYLSEPGGPGYGTAFWSHQEHGAQLDPAELTPELAAQLDRDGQDDERWQLVGFVAQRVNRFVTYPVSLFHSRMPQRVPADHRDRLIQAFFFD